MKRIFLVLSFLATPALAEQPPIASPSPDPVVTFITHDVAEFDSLVRVPADAKVPGGFDIIALDRDCPRQEHVYIVVAAPTAKFIVCTGDAKESAQ